MRLRLAPLAIALFLMGSAAHAADPGCTIVTDEEVARVFERVGDRDGSAAGSCVWKIGDDSLAVQVIRRASAAEAREMFDGLEREVIAAVKPSPARPRIGQKAAAGMSAPGSADPHATVIVLDREWVTVVSYMARTDARLAPALLDKVVSVARQANARAAQADQSLGGCEWFSKDEAAALLGTAGLTIQRHGPTLCMASSARPSAVLMVAAPGRIDAEARANKRRNDEEICTVTPMPELGAQAYVAHACRMLPGIPPLPNMEAYVQKNGRYAEIVYVPGGGRPAGSADLTLLIPVMRRTLGGL